MPLRFAVAAPKQVADFNLSKLMEEGPGGSSLSATNPRWLAPEVLQGERHTFASVGDPPA